MAKESTLTLIPASQYSINRGKKTAEQRSATVNVKHETIVFSKEYIQEYGLDGKFIKFYLDVSKNVLAWKFGMKEDGLDKLSDYKKVKKTNSGKTSVYLMFVGSPLKAFTKLKEVSYRKLPIETYSPQGLLEEGKCHYVVLKNSRSHEKNNTSKEQTSSNC